MLSFFGTAGVKAALHATDFDLQEEVETLIGHIRSDDPTVSLSGQRQFRALMREIASTSGQVGRVSVTADANGVVQQRSMTMTVPAGTLGATPSLLGDPDAQAPFATTRASVGESAASPLPAPIRRSVAFTGDPDVPFGGGDHEPDGEEGDR